MTALHAEGVPVPEVPVICDDPDVLDGRPFILMEAVDGVRADVAASRWDQVALAKSALEVLKLLHSLPIEVTGLADEAEVQMADELARWASVLAKGPEELIATGGAVRSALAAVMPPDGPAHLVHGDFTYGNLLFKDGQVSAVLDWEIAHRGQPLADLGSLCVIAKRQEFPLDPNPSGAIRASVPWLLAEYGVAGQHAEWFVAFSYFKYAAIVAYNTMLHRRGKRPDPIYDAMPDTVTGLLLGALEIL